jgi:hypothetical protein
MSENDYYLFTDETGIPNPLDKCSNIYILCGCTVLKEQRSSLKKHADQIKFKYWGKDNIVFHSFDIANNSKDFKIFLNKKQEKEKFLKDLFVFLEKAPVKILSVVVEKKKARSKGWNNRKILSATTSLLLKEFASMTYAKGFVKGRIIIESSTEKDTFYLKAFNFLLANGISELKISHHEIKDCITSISFVTKNNQDIETQIADLFAYGAKCHYMSKYKKVKYSESSYESKILDVFNKKLFYIDPRTGKKKKKILKKIEPFCVIPK